MEKWRVGKLLMVRLREDDNCLYNEFGLVISSALRWPLVRLIQPYVSVYFGGMLCVCICGLLYWQGTFQVPWFSCGSWLIFCRFWRSVFRVRRFRVRMSGRVGVGGGVDLRRLPGVVCASDVAHEDEGGSNAPFRIAGHPRLCSGAFKTPVFWAVLRHGDWFVDWSAVTRCQKCK